jgi:NADH-quinone oxidoreductase subunit H
MNWISTHIPPWFFIAIVAHLAILGTVAYLILLERKVASWAQDRIGPNRVGLGGLLPLILLPLAPFINVDKIADKVRGMHMGGLGQPLADGLKFILKEDYRPKGVDRVLFTVAPMVMIIVVIISIAVLPWGGIVQKHVMLQPGQQASDVVTAGATVIAQTPNSVTYRYPFQIASLNIGVLYVLAVLSLAVYGVVIGGWASNNKYSFLGGLRATANMISYEIPLGLAVLSVVVLFGSLDLNELVAKQAHYWGFTVSGHHIGLIPAWNAFSQPLAFFLFLVCIHAEANRAPFDLAEAEQELVGGYHTEYSAMRFALFFLAEYAGMITTSAVCVALFFGGWHIPYVDQIWPQIFGGGLDPHNPAVISSLWVCLLRAIVFFIKTIVIVFVFMWTRWSLPRFRFDQLMQLAWRGLIPVSLALLAGSAIVVYWWGDRFRGAANEMLIPGGMAVALLVVNIAIGVLTMIISRIIPAAPNTNRRIAIGGSRFATTPLPAGVTN